MLPRPGSSPAAAAHSRRWSLPEPACRRCKAAHAVQGRWQRPGQRRGAGGSLLVAYVRGKPCWPGWPGLRDAGVRLEACHDASWRQGAGHTQACAVGSGLPAASCRCSACWLTCPPPYPPSCPTCPFPCRACLLHRSAKATTSRWRKSRPTLAAAQVRSSVVGGPHCPHCCTAEGSKLQARLTGGIKALAAAASHRSMEAAPPLRPAAAPV